jgi:hypothetical protein
MRPWVETTLLVSASAIVGGSGAAGVHGRRCSSITAAAAAPLVEAHLGAASRAAAHEAVYSRIRSYTVDPPVWGASDRALIVND